MDLFRCYDKERFRLHAKRWILWPRYGAASIIDGPLIQKFLSRATERTSVRLHRYVLTSSSHGRRENGV